MNTTTRWPSVDRSPTPTGWARPGNLMPADVPRSWPRGRRATSEAEEILATAEAWWDVDRSGFRDGDRYLRNIGTAGSALDLRLGSSGVANSNDPKYLAPEDTGYAYLPGVASNYLSVPDEAALDITSDIDLRLLVAVDSWTPASTSDFMAKWIAAQQSYYFQILATGRLRLNWTTNGSTTISKDSTASVSGLPGQPLWVRVTLTVNNGATQNEVRFYTSVDGASWAQLGTTVTTAGTTSIFSGTSPLSIGAYNTGSGPITGKIYRAQVLNGINGSTVLDIDADAITSGAATTFTATTGQTVTINRATSGRKSVAMPSTITRKVDDAHVYLPGVASNYLSVPDEAALRITGDIDLRVQVAQDSVSGTEFGFISKDNGTAYSYTFRRLAAGTYNFLWIDSGSVQRQVTSSTTASATAWVRVTMSVNNGAGGHDVKFWESTDGATWAQVGTTQNAGAFTSSILASTYTLYVGTRSGTAAMLSGRIYRAQVLNGINGTTVLDVVCGIAPGNFVPGVPSTFAASTGQAVTLNSTAGSAMAVRPIRFSRGRPCMLLGTDDYLECQDAAQHGLLNFYGGDSFTVLAVVRVYSSQAAGKQILSKARLSATGHTGYLIQSDTSAFRLISIDDGVTRTNPNSATVSAGVNNVAIGVRDASSRRVTPYLNGTAGTSASDLTTRSLANQLNVTIGNSAAPAGNSNYADMEFRAAAIFRRALTAREITVIANAAPWGV